MTLKEWLNNKGLDTVTEELRELAEPLANGKITVTTEDDGDEGIMFLFNFEDDSYVNQELWFDEDENDFDDYDTTALLVDLAGAIWENAHDLINSDYFNGYQRDFIMKLSDWEDANR